MHEMGIMSGVLQTVVASAEQAGATRVTSVQLSIGRMTEAIEEILVFAWEALFIISRDVAKHQFVLVDLFSVPHTGMETRRTAMQMVRTIVDSQAVVLAIHGEVSLGNAVAIAAHKGAEEGFRTVHHVLYGVMSLYNIGHLAFLVGNHDGHYSTSVVGDANFHTVSVREYEEVSLLTLNDSLEVLSLESGNKYFVHRRIISLK